jgi:nucleotide-binding universal stress UspA family protein
MITRVVVPLDGSEHAVRAVGPARALAEATGAWLRLVTTRWDNEVDHARQHLEHEAAALGFDRVETVVVHDRSAPEAILVESREAGSVVCMATHGRGGVRQMVLGSVAEAVLRGSSRPILLVGPSVERGVWQFAQWFLHGNLLVALDGSKISEVILPVAADWAGLLELREWMVQVLPPSTDAGIDAPERQTESAYVRNVARGMHAADSPSQWEILHAPDAAEALIAYACRLPATMVAMATHGRTGLARVALGSVAMRVVHHSPCPVLVLRPADLID